MDKNSGFLAAEALSNLDPIELAEESLGKRWEEFTEAEQMMALGQAVNLNTLQQGMEKSMGDTHMGCSIVTVDNILRENKFVIGYISRRISKYGYSEREVIWYRPDGLIVYYDTYNSTRPNRLEMYGEITPPPGKFFEHYHMLDRVCNGGGSFGMYPMGFDVPEEGRVLTFNADMRSGLRRKLEIIKTIGEPCPVWKEEGKFIWLINYDEESYDIDRNAILKKKMMVATPQLKHILQIYL